MIKEWINRNPRLIILLIIVVALISFVKHMKNVIFDSAKDQIEQAHEAVKTELKKVVNNILPRQKKILKKIKRIFTNYYTYIFWIILIIIITPKMLVEIRINKMLKKDKKDK